MPNIYGRCAFEYNPGSGLILLQLPIIHCTFDHERETTKIINRSVDKTRVETDVLGHSFLVSLQGSFMTESDKASFYDFEEWAADGNSFTFYPHYPTNNRPAFYKSAYTDCIVADDYKPNLSRSEGVAGQYNFNIKFNALAWED